MAQIDESDEAEARETSDSPIYRDLMRFRPANLSANAWAVRAGVNRTVWADMRRHGNPSRRTLGKLLAAANSSLAEFEALRLGGAGPRFGASRGALGDKQGWAWNPARLPSLPLVAASLSGEWGSAGSAIELAQIRREEIIDRLPRPASLAADGAAYALPVVGDSMWPRFRPGRLIAVSPKSPVGIGDDVIVSVRVSDASEMGTPVLIKELVKRTKAGIELRQFKPDLSFLVDLSEIESIHKIVGELI